MKFDPEKHHRCSIRLKGHDYSSPGSYFVTILTKDRFPYFGSIEDAVMSLSEIGKQTEKIWHRTPSRYKNTVLDEFIIMPNHIHGIIGLIDCSSGKGVCTNAPESSNYYSRISPPKQSLPVIIRSFKSTVTRWCCDSEYYHFQWHRSFYDHIIRSEKQLSSIRHYICTNPVNWAADPERIK